MATTMLSDEMVTTNPMKSNAAAGGNVGGGGGGGAASKALAFGAGALARFSTAATQMTGEGLVEYAIFMDPKSLTKIPSAKGFWGKCAQMICTCVGGYENNRLKHLKSSIFPKLDGPVYIYDINSKEGDTFVCLNDRDTNSAGVRRAVRVAGGLFQRNVLYKLLAKEQTLVPASDWAEEHERSEINEVLTLLQLTGAIAVNFEHGPSSTQIGDILDMPIETAEGASLLAVFSAYSGRFFKMFARSATSAASAAAKGQAFGGAARSALSGRVLFRSNERPQAALDSVIADLGADFFHIRSQPAVLSVLKMRMGRGVQMATTFTFKHYAADSTWLEAMHELQVKNTPPVPGIKMSEADVIDCGFRSGQRRQRFETTFTVIFPDVKDGTDKRLLGDITPEANGFTAGEWHPQSHLTKLDMPLLITNKAGQGQSGGAAAAAGTTADKAAPKEASGGIIGSIMRRVTGSKAEAGGDSSS